MSLGKLNSDHTFRWWCPGCECMHVVPVAGTVAWGFNGDCDRPTLTPSVLVYSHRTLIDNSLEGDALLAPDNVRDTPQCHSFIRDGMIQYLGDCTHALADQTVPMEPLDE
jgi:hypothetical protein